MLVSDKLDEQDEEELSLTSEEPTEELSTYQERLLSELLEQEEEELSLSSEEPTEEISRTQEIDSTPTIAPLPLVPVVFIMTSKVTINGIDIEVEDTPQQVTETDQCLYKKEDRETSKDRNALLEKATKTSQPKFDLMTLSVTDPEKLADTYNLQMLIAKMRQNNVRHDLADVFSVLKFDTTNKLSISSVVALYQDYMQVTEAEVALSCEWYATMPKGKRRQFFIENLKLSFDYMENNTKDQLFTKCLETYADYPASQKGGPLFFKIMIDQLQTNSEDATQYLLDTLKNLKISNFKGEDVTTVVSLIRGAVSRLKNIRNPHTHTHAVPEDLAKTLLGVFQTSSVSDFNEFFKHMSISCRVNQVKQGLSALPTIEELLHAAESNYRDLSVADKWTGVSTKKSETGFTAGGPRARGAALVCWNCDTPGHSSRDCTKPKDTDRISRNRLAFQKKKEERTGGPRRDGQDMTPTGKFAPPTVDETRGPNGARTSGRRSIDGVPHFYKRADRRWYPVDTSPPPPQGHVQFPSQHSPPPQRPASPTLTEGTSFTPATQPPPPDSSE